MSSPRFRRKGEPSGSDWRGDDEGDRYGGDRYDDDKGGRKEKGRYDDDKGGRKGKDWYDDDKGGKGGRKGKDRYDDEKGGKGGRWGRDRYDDDKGGKGGRWGKGDRRSRSRSYGGKGARRSRSRSYGGRGKGRGRSRSYDGRGKGARRSRSRSHDGRGSRWRRSRSRDGKGDRWGKDWHDGKGKGKDSFRDKGKGSGKKGKKGRDRDDDCTTEGKGDTGLKWSVGCWRKDDWDKDDFDSKGGGPEKRKAPCDYEADAEGSEKGKGKDKGKGKGDNTKSIDEVFVLFDQQVADKVRLIQGDDGHESSLFDAYVLNRMLDFSPYDALVLLGNFQNALETKELRKPKAFLNRMITDKWGLTEVDFDESATRKEVNALIRDVKALGFGSLDPNVMRTINSIDAPTAVASLKQLLETRNLDDVKNMSGYTMKLIRRIQLRQAEKATLETVFEKVEGMKKKGVITADEPLDRRSISYLEAADPKLSMDALNEMEAHWTLGKVCRSINARLVSLLASRERAVGRQHAYDSHRQRRTDRESDTWNAQVEAVTEDAEHAAKRHREIDFSDLSAAPEPWGASSGYQSPPRALKPYR
eukprot:GEMP01020265.1.p1 GENE.GEMP01020265.1~~GEMP01020265.1.p1  ORF type:complete len:602 (+),score=161.56 GEMP01020265.1:51-1808(+)